MDTYNDLSLQELNIPDDIKIRYKLLYGDYVTIGFTDFRDFKEGLHTLFKNNEFTIPPHTLFLASDLCVFLKCVQVSIKIIHKKDGTIKKIKLV